jgi:2-polyprenyl-6-methoxyphenol hydroxylase-like FAD-dependent oxidoreductase
MPGELGPDRDPQGTRRVGDPVGPIRRSQAGTVEGLGGNTALRDAHALCAALTAADRGEEPLLQALRAYEADLLRFGLRTVREAVRDTEAAITRAVLKRSATRWFSRTRAAVPPLGRAVFGESRGLSVGVTTP